MKWTPPSRARAAFAEWSGTPIKQRVQIFYRYKMLLERDLHSLAALVSEENGKILSETLPKCSRPPSSPNSPVHCRRSPAAKCWK